MAGPGQNAGPQAQPPLSREMRPGGGRGSPDAESRAGGPIQRPSAGGGGGVEGSEEEERRRSRRGQENRPRSGEEAETKHPTAAQRRGQAGPLSAPPSPPVSLRSRSGPRGPPRTNRRGGRPGPAAARGGSEEVRSATGTPRQGARPAPPGSGAGSAAAPTGSEAALDARPSPGTYVGPGRVGLRGEGGGRRLGGEGRRRRGTAEVAAVGPSCASPPSGPRTAGAGPAPALESLHPGRSVQVLLLLCSPRNS